MKVIVYFDGTFWSALVEYIDSQKHFRAFRYIFEKEPNNQEVEDFLNDILGKELKKFEKIDFKDTQISEFLPKKKNPKRMQRELNKAKKKPVISTKAQLALTELHDALKKEKKSSQKEKRESEKLLKYQKKQITRHQKRKGH